jgi:hypothetical protein
MNRYVNQRPNQIDIKDRAERHPQIFNLQYTILRGTGLGDKQTKRASLIKEAPINYPTHIPLRP